MVRTYLTSPPQLLRSWYIGFFQLPRLPERFLTARHARSMLTMLAPGNFSDDEIEVYRDAICSPGAAWAGLALETPLLVAIGGALVMGSLAVGLVLFGRSLRA